MSRFVKHVVVLLALLIAPFSAALSAELKAQALYDLGQLELLSQGSEVTYRFQKTGSDERLVGANMADDIKLAIAKVNDKGQRDVVIRVFTGEYARDPSSFPELSTNPLLIWFLDRTVSQFKALAGGDHMYLKKRFVDALADSAKVETVKIDVDGKQADATKVTVLPYSNDPSAKKMQGFEYSRWEFIVSKAVPGYIYDFKASFDNKGAAGPKMEEQIKFTSVTGGAK